MKSGEMEYRTVVGRLSGRFCRWFDSGSLRINHGLKGRVLLVLVSCPATHIFNLSHTEVIRRRVEKGVLKWDDRGFGSGVILVQV